jgi:hypothetical protein
MNRRKHSHFLSCFPAVFLNADDGANGVGGNSASGDQNQGNQNQNGNQSGNAPGGNANHGNQSQNSQQSQNFQSDKQPDFKAIAQAVVAEVLEANSVKGDQAKALEVLAGRNARLEADRDAKVQEIGRLKAQLPDSKQAQADADELAAWRKLSESGLKKPEDVSALIAERDDFKGREEARAKVEQRDKAATAAGYDPAKFAALKGVDEWQYEVKTEKQDGKDVPVAYVVSKDDKGVETRKALSDVVTENFAALADSIKAGESQGESTPGARTVAQGSGGTSGAGNVFDKIRKTAEERHKAQEPSGPSLEERLNMKTG